MYLPEVDRASLHDSEGVLILCVCVCVSRGEVWAGQQPARKSSGFECRKEAVAKVKLQLKFRLFKNIHF